METRIQDLVRLLPYDFRDKLRHYLDYVHDRLVDIALEENAYSRVSQVRDEVDLVFLLKLLYGYFVVGFANYDQMLRFFESKKVSGFQIGSTAFTRDSSLTFEWQQISAELEKLIVESEVARYVRPTVSIDEALRQIIQAASDEKTKE